MMMIYKTKDLKKMIPMYLNGRLSEDENREFENALESNPELADELNDFSDINTYYQGMEDEIPQPASNLYSRVISNIRSEEKKQSRSLTADTADSIREFFTNTFSTPRLAWACAAVQFAVIIVLLVANPIGNNEDNNMITLSGPNHVITKNAVMINVVFNAETKEKEIRELLNRTETNIISGPAPNGVYILVVSENKNVETILEEFDNSPIINNVGVVY